MKTLKESLFDKELSNKSARGVACVGDPKETENQIRKIISKYNKMLDKYNVGWEVYSVGSYVSTTVIANFEYHFADSELFHKHGYSLDILFNMCIMVSNNSKGWFSSPVAVIQIKPGTPGTSEIYSWICGEYLRKNIPFKKKENVDWVFDFQNPNDIEKVFSTIDGLIKHIFTKDKLEEIKDFLCPIFDKYLSDEYTNKDIVKKRGEMMDKLKNVFA